MRVVEISDDEHTYWIRADSIESAVSYWVENCADLADSGDEPLPEGRFLESTELDEYKVYDEDNDWTHTFRDAMKMDTDIAVPYLLAQTD